ncbi:MAG TPA: Uma2 family endonuclease [Thermoanaerobaculia bacterium]|jgi:Uma2 family endonuclease|nr:Uma2 family endonuclease [Thermoanaerobaculia bacterium]
MGQPATAALAPLPFELIDSDEEPLETDWHVRQLPLLREAIHRAMAELGRADFFVGTNMFVYYSVEQAAEVAREVEENLEPRAFRGPDVFWTGGVSGHLRRLWAAWDEGGRLPDMIIELLSPSTAKVDRTVKKDLYAQVFRTKEYFMVDPDALTVEGFDLVGRVYQPKAPAAQGRVWCSQLRAYLGFWHGIWTDAEADWVRLFHLDGSLLPTKAEAAEQRAEAAEADVARLRALLEERDRS